MDLALFGKLLIMVIILLQNLVMSKFSAISRRPTVAMLLTPVMLRITHKFWSVPEFNSKGKGCFFLLDYISLNSLF